MPKRYPLFLGTRVQTVLDTDYLAGVGDVYFGTARYERGQTRHYSMQGSTDNNGRVTLYLTTNGLASGTAMFSAVHTVQATGFYNGTAPGQAPNFYVEQISTDRKTLVVRCLTYVSILGVLNVSFGGAGIPVYVDVRGLP